jgi:hypothetical protein
MVVNGEKWFRFITYITNGCCGGFCINPDTPDERLNWFQDWPADVLEDMLSWDMNMLNHWLGSSITPPTNFTNRDGNESTPGCFFGDESTPGCHIAYGFPPLKGRHTNSQSTHLANMRFYKPTFKNGSPGLSVYLKLIEHGMYPRYEIAFISKSDEQMYVVLSFELYSNHDSPQETPASNCRQI